MAADLYLHVLENCTEEDLRIFNARVLGSKWFNPFGQNIYSPEDRPEWEPRFEGDTDRSDESLAFTRVSNSPAVWVGEVSWLSAMLAEDETAFVPTTVSHIHKLIGEELPELTAEMKDGIMFGFKLPNVTSYTISDYHAVERFLTAHLGKRLFTVSW